MNQQKQQQHTILLKLAEQIFTSDFASKVNEQYQQLIEIKPKFDYIIQTAQTIGVDQLTVPSLIARDTFYNAFLVRDSVFNELPDVLAKLRKIQTEFEKKVLNQYQKEAYHLKGRNTPLPEDYLWLHVLPVEVSDLIMNILSQCPNDILAKYQIQLNKYKTTVQDSLASVVDAASRNTMVSSGNIQKLEQSTTLTDDMKNNIVTKAVDSNQMKLSVNDLNKIENQ